MSFKHFVAIRNMPEPLFTYNYHEQFLEAVSKYRILFLNLFDELITSVGSSKSKS